jgi:hypothetical protein
MKTQSRSCLPGWTSRLAATRDQVMCYAKLSCTVFPVGSTLNGKNLTLDPGPYHIHRRTPYRKMDSEWQIPGEKTLHCVGMEFVLCWKVDFYNLDIGFRLQHGEAKQP